MKPVPFFAPVLAGLAAAGELQSTIAPLFKPGGDIIPGRYIVKLKSGISLLSTGEAVAKYVSSADNVYKNVFDGFATALDEAELAFLRLSPSVSDLGFGRGRLFSNGIETGRLCRARCGPEASELRRSAKRRMEPRTHFPSPARKHHVHLRQLGGGRDLFVCPRHGYCRQPPCMTSLFSFSPHIFHV